MLQVIVPAVSSLFFRSLNTRGFPSLRARSIEIIPTLGPKPGDSSVVPFWGSILYMVPSQKTGHN